MSGLSNLWASIQDFLYPALEEDHGELSAKQRQFIAVCELAALDRHMGAYTGHRLGRKKKPRVDFAKAFVAKAVYGFGTTKLLIEHLAGCGTLRRLCGWERKQDLPCEATFSNAFAEFAAKGLGDAVHQAMVRRHYGGKLAGHISRDATAVAAREKAAAKPEKEKKDRPRRKRGRPEKGERRAPKPPRRLELQPTRGLAENLADLPQTCGWGRKKNSQGKIEQWKGYKLHLDVIDGDIPISAILTSASLHDSQAAIPLAQMSAGRVTNLYDLMDAAYDAKEIRRFASDLGHRALIDANPRDQEKRPMDPADARRYNERSAAERVNAMLKDSHGGRHVRVRGAAKVRLHLLFGVIVICARQLLRLLE